MVTRYFGGHGIRRPSIRGVYSIFKMAFIMIILSFNLIRGVGSWLAQLKIVF